MFLPATQQNKKKRRTSFLPNNTTNAEASVAQLKHISLLNSVGVLHTLETDAMGLSQEQVAERIDKFGNNEVKHEKVAPWYIQLFQAFVNPFIIVLLLIASISFIMDVVLVAPVDRDFKTVMVVFVMVMLSSLIRFWQEFRSNIAVNKLQNMVQTTATVLRIETAKCEVDIKALVPGDIVLLSAGDMIPADCRVIHSKDLFVSQAILTGEALPIEKREQPTTILQNKGTLELENICFMGTNVVSGTAKAVVVCTGTNTYLGSISKGLTGARAATSFDKGVNSVSWLLIRFMLVMVPVVFIINVFTKGNWIEAMLFGIAVAVGLTPEMLPMIVTANLAKGAVNMSKRKVIVKRLNAIQNIGAMDVLCTDKTGTLTLDKIVLERHLNVEGDEDDEVLKWAYLNSHHQTGLKNLLDVSILEHAEVKDYVKVEDHYKKVDEIPFDFQRRRMSVILEQPNHTHLLICKGAVEEILSLCSHAFDPGENLELHKEMDKVVAIDNTIRNNILSLNKKLNKEGLRVLLVAIKEFKERPLTYSVADEKDMVVTGFIGFLDPAKPSAKPSIEAIQKLGVALKVLTGDNDVVTKKICRDVGIPINNIMLGHELEQITDAELSERVDNIGVFAKLSPEQKTRVVKCLQSKGHTVGFMGDGINDAGALRAADVGISVDTAVDIAKESADIILLEKDLMVLRKGIIYGRRTFGNIIKYIKMTASSNFGNMFSVLGASFLLPFLPMLPIQILVQNLLYDISQIGIPWDKMDKDYLNLPRRWHAGGIARFMLCLGPVSSLFDYVTFGILYWVFAANTICNQNLFQTGWFVEGLLSQTLIVHMIRTKKIPFIQSWATAPVVALTTLIMAVGVFIPFSPFATALRLTPLPLGYFPWLIGILICYCFLTQLVKQWYIKKFAQWL